MPLEILGPMVVFGILGIALLLHLAGQTDPLRLKNEKDVIRAWQREHPDDEVTRIHIAANKRSALLRTKEGALGLVRTLGADTALHDLSQSQWSTKGNTLTLRSDDFSAPRIRLTLAPEEQALWASLRDKT